MKFTISNIAWDPRDDARIADSMRACGVTGVEIAPTKLWQDPLDVDESAVREYRDFWETRGITITSMQALLFGRPDLTIFQDGAARQATLAYLSGIIRLAGRLGAEVLVFGSPGNRRVGDLPAQQVRATAVEFFRRVGEISQDAGVIFCIEPNPVAYGCDFITDSAQGRELVKDVDHPGFGLHLDAAAMVMSEEDIPAALRATGSALCHFHISEPQLAPIGSGGVDHERIARELKKLNYRRWRSIEMRPPGADDNVAAVSQAMEKAVTLYS